MNGINLRGLPRQQAQAAIDKEAVDTAELKHINYTASNFCWRQRDNSFYARLFDGVLIKVDVSALRGVLKEYYHAGKEDLPAQEQVIAFKTRLVYDPSKILQTF